MASRAICSSFSRDLCATGEHFFTNTENRLAKFFKMADGRDKALKIADPIFDAMGEIAKASGASKDTITGIQKGRDLAKAGRDAHSFFNIYFMIPILVQHVRNMCSLIAGIVMCEDEIQIVSGKSFKGKDGKDLENSQLLLTTVKGDERWLALGSNFGKAVGGITYIFAFGVCRPIANLHKYIRDKDGKSLLDMSETTLDIGRSFSLVMFINHIGAFIGHSFEIGYQVKAFDNHTQSASWSLKTKDEKDDKYDKVINKIVTESLSLIEKSLELIMDIAGMIGHAAPAWFRIPVNLSIGGIGVYKVWLKTA